MPNGSQCFSKEVLRETCDPAKAFNGLNLCRETSKMLLEEMRRNNVKENFTIVRDPEDNHHFLYEPIEHEVADPTYKQFLTTLFADHAILKTYPELLRVKLEKSAEPKELKEFRMHIAQKPIIFFGSMEELKKNLTASAQQLVEVLKLPRDLGQCVVEELYKCYGNFQPENFVIVTPKPNVNPLESEAAMGLQKPRSSR
jgi:hypothetical protein